MRYSHAVIEHFYARRAHTWSARTDSLLRQQVNTNDLSGSQPFFPPGLTMVQVQVSMKVTHVIYILRHQYKPTRFIILFIA